MSIEKLQNILKTKSTTFVRKTFDEYCKPLNIEKWNYKINQERWSFSEYDCKRRLRTICRLRDNNHELNITLRKKAGYYLIIEYDRKRIFECVPEVIKLDEEKLNIVIDKYSELFKMLFEEYEG